jgi:hypothetical protein
MPKAQMAQKVQRAQMKQTVLPVPQMIVNQNLAQ